MRETDPTADAGRGAVRDVSLDVARYVADRDAARDREPAASDGARRRAAVPAGPTPMAGRMQFRAAWVDRVVDQAIARGEFDNLPAGRASRSRASARATTPTGGSRR